MEKNYLVHNIWLHILWGWVCNFPVSIFTYYCPTCGEGGVKRCFCPSIRTSVRPSVAYIAINWKTQKPSVPKFGMKVPHLWCDSHDIFKVKRSKVNVTKPTNGDTHRAPYLPNGKSYELQTWYMDGGRRPASATGAMTSMVKGQGPKVTWSVWAVLASWPNMLYLCH